MEYYTSLVYPLGGKDVYIKVIHVGEFDRST